MEGFRWKLGFLTFYAVCLHYQLNTWHLHNFFTSAIVVSSAFETSHHSCSPDSVHWIFAIVEMNGCPCPLLTCPWGWLWDFHGRWAQGPSLRYGDEPCTFIWSWFSTDRSWSSLSTLCKTWLATVTLQHDKALHNLMAYDNLVWFYAIAWNTFFEPHQMWGKLPPQFEKKWWALC